MSQSLIYIQTIIYTYIVLHLNYYINVKLYRTYARTYAVQMAYTSCIVLAMRMVVGGGFEPPKASPTDLQSVPFDHSGTPPFFVWSQRRDSNPRPTDYKSVALPTELRWPINTFLITRIIILNKLIIFLQPLKLMIIRLYIPLLFNIMLFTAFFFLYLNLYNIYYLLIYITIFNNSCLYENDKL